MHFYSFSEWYQYHLNEYSDSARLVDIGHQKYSMLDSKEEQVIDEDLDFELIGEVQLRLGPLLDPKKELVQCDFALL